MASPWREFGHGMCEMMNSSCCLVLVGDTDVITPLLPAVDAACCSADVVAAFASADGAPPSATHCGALADMPRVLFTSAANQKMVQRCMAVHGRVPFLAVTDMRDDDDAFSFVLDLASDAAAPTAEEDVMAFMIRVGRGAEPRSRQGAPPPPGNAFEPSHGAVLCEARAAVASTFSRLISGDAAPTAARQSGAVCVFWSDRCHCCPGVLMLMEAVVHLIRRVAARHVGHTAAAHACLDFPFLAANIDDNDFTPAEWPVAQREQVVPCVVAYTGPSRTPVVYAGERTPARLAAFVCTHCLPSSDVIACSAFIAEEVARVAAQLSADALMTSIDESSAPYCAAVRAWATMTAAVTADGGDEPLRAAVALEDLHAVLRETRSACLPPLVEEAVRAVLAEGGAAAGRSPTESLPRSRDDDDDGNTNDGGRGASDGKVEKKTRTAPRATEEVSPASPTSTAAAARSPTSLKRQRE
ncbi:hypothetical protein NESM_000538100 [Novymonas esmeraldas]|uniref:Thioredoxin domain-containing protein n=1 Tax=Novymonas esmeraldas TaxID=1808958 RepID=A0AAW0EQP3_9TRYP